jgi:hypothetical protein
LIINLLKNLLKEWSKELAVEATIRKFRIVQKD